jgi:hypothetical protein
MILAVSRVNRSQNRTSLFQAFADDFKGLCGQRRFVEQRFTTPQLLGPIGSMRRRDGEVETPGAGRGLSIHRVRPGMSAAAGTVGLSVDAVSVVTDAEGESALDERAGIALELRLHTHAAKLGAAGEDLSPCAAPSEVFAPAHGSRNQFGHRGNRQRAKIRTTRASGAPTPKRPTERTAGRGPMASRDNALLRR